MKTAQAHITIFQSIKYISLLVITFSVAACNEHTEIGSTSNAQKSHTQHQTLVSKEKSIEPHSKHTGDSSLLAVVAAANRVVLSDQNTVRARKIDTAIKVKAYGFITWDKRRNRNVAARTNGRVENLFVKYNYQYVTAGQKILNLYTPEINAYAAEYLYHLAASGDDTLLNLSRQKLQLLGITDQQLNELEKTRKVPENISMFSPAGGYVLFEENNSGQDYMSDVVIPDGMAGGMMGASSVNGTNSGVNASPQVQLREGMYVTKGQTLFKLNDLFAVWGLLAFDDVSQSLLQKNIKVEIKSELLSKPVISRISLVEPTFNNANQKFTQARVYMPNPGRKLKINSLIEGSVDISLNSQIIIPANAVFSLGQRRIVWVKTGELSEGKNIFEARNIKISMMNNEIAVVTSNLAANEEVAADAGYLLDSQSLIEQ